MAPWPNALASHGEPHIVRERTARGTSSLASILPHTAWLGSGAEFWHDIPKQNKTSPVCYENITRGPEKFLITEIDTTSDHGGRK